VRDFDPAHVACAAAGHSGGLRNRPTKCFGLRLIMLDCGSLLTGRDSTIPFPLIVEATRASVTDKNRNFCMRQDLCCDAAEHHRLNPGPPV
jgi:hypothetical protein